MGPFSLKVRALLFWPIALICIARGLLLFPLIPHSEKVPQIFHSFPAAPYIFSVLWIISGALLILGSSIGHKLIIIRGNRAKLRMDDVGILLTIGMYATWALSYYSSWFFGVIGWTSPNQDYTAGRNYIPWAISGLVAWVLWFNYRTDHPDVEEETYILP